MLRRSGQHAAAFSRLNLTCQHVTVKSSALFCTACTVFGLPSLPLFPFLPFLPALCFRCAPCYVVCLSMFSLLGDDDVISRHMDDEDDSRGYIPSRTAPWHVRNRREPGSRRTLTPSPWPTVMTASGLMKQICRRFHIGTAATMCRAPLVVSKMPGVLPLHGPRCYLLCK